MNEEMSHGEFIRAQFFTPESEMPPAKKPRRSRKSDPEMLALRRIVKAFQTMTPRARWAAIRWLVDVYHVTDRAPEDEASR